MNVNQVCKIGIKILAAVITGAAVIAGIEKTMGGGNRAPEPVNPGNGGNPTPPVSSDGENTKGGGSFKQAEGIQTGPSKTDVILSGIRGAGETCGKLFTVAQSIAQVIESVSSVFGNYQGRGSGGPAYYVPGGNSYNPQQQSFQSGNIAWVPVGGSNCILQAVPVNNSGRW